MKTTLTTTIGSTEAWTGWMYADCRFREDTDIVLHNFGLVDGKLTKIY